MSHRGKIVGIIPTFVVVVAGFLLFEFLASEYREYGDRLYRQRIATRTTLARITAIGEALEKVSTRGDFPCIRSRADFPKVAEAHLPLGAFKDAWGGAISVRSSPRRYVIVSLGSDGRLDDHYEGKHFSGTSGDIVYSDGDWLHVHESIVTLLDLVPKPDDAIAEASDCGKPFSSPWGASRLSSLYKAGHAPGLSACESHLYFKTEREARASATEAAGAGFSPELRVAVDGNWLVIARKVPAVCAEADLLLWEIGKRHNILRW